MEARLAEPDEVRVARAAHRAEQREIVDRLEEVRLAVPVLADDDEPVGGEAEIEAGDVAEVPYRQALEADAPVGAGAGGRAHGRRAGAGLTVR